jgi:hypothetical protein
LKFQKISNLQKTLDKVNLLYHDLVSTKSVLKVENEVK